MKSDFKFKLGGPKKRVTVLGLALDGSQLEGVVLRRTNGSLAVLQSFSATLALDPLTAAPELVGREIRNQLDAAGVRERHCVFGVPLKWVLTAQTELPPLPAADADSLLQLEAEKGFHSDVATLQISDSRSPLADGKQNVLLAGIPGTHIAALEKILASAKLKPVSFALGLSALQFAGDEKSGGILALVIGESHVGLQITAGGGVVALRALEGALTDEGGRRALLADVVARETRVTLGQLPGGLRDAVKRIRVFGPREQARQLADAMEARFAPMGLKIEVVAGYAADEFGVSLPVEASLSAAFSLAARLLTGSPPAFEFLPPKPNFIEQFATKYSSGRLRTTGAVVGGVVAVFLGLFMFQQVQLWHYRSQWSQMSAKVGQLQVIQDNIRQYRAWYDGSFKNLAILRLLSVAFPEDGSVTAKNIEVRDGNTVTCSGTARDSSAVLAVESKLSALPGISGVHREQSRGKAPMQFVLSFKFNNGGGNEN